MSARRRLSAALATSLGLLSLLLVAAPAEAALQYLGKFGSAGTGPGQFSDPEGIAVAPDGSIYVADTGNDRIQKFDANFNFVAQWGSSGSGSGQFDDPTAVTVDGVGNVTVADSDNNRLPRFGPAGGSPLGCPPCGSYTNPEGIEAYNTIWYVADSAANRIVRVTGATVSSFGTTGTGNGQFATPGGVTVNPSGEVYVADTFNDRIQKFSSTGVFQLTFGSGPATGPANLWRPEDIASDPVGRLFIADTVNNRVQRFSGSGGSLGPFGSAGAGNGQFSGPKGIATDCRGNVYVADTGNDRIQKLGEPGNSKPPCSGPVPGDTTAPVMEVEGGPLKMNRRGRLKVELGCPADEASSPCSGKATLRTRRKFAGKRVKIGKSGFEIPSDGRQKIKLEASRKAQKLIKRKRKARKAELIVKASDSAGNKGTQKSQLKVKPK